MCISEHSSVFYRYRGVIINALVNNNNNISMKALHK